MSDATELRVQLPDAAQLHHAWCTVDVHVVCTRTCLEIHVDGYGEHEAAAGEGATVLLEYYNGRLRLIVAPDINSGERQIIDLEGARETARKPETNETC